jgi:hypothetical protein
MAGYILHLLVKNVRGDGVEKWVVIVVDAMVIKDSGGALGSAAP